ncbi:MAG TPA: Crp/Fnr family transcriptional regulator [Bdellovibrionota bacterium]|nr:Crp/Fnr family transcriptional regulator [Bdellovibrionota bacterium]
MLAAKPRNCATCPTRIDSVFCSLPQEHLETLNRHKTTNRYRRGQTLFYEGNPATGLFCVGNGKIKLFKNGSDGKEVILRIAKGGDILGYWSVLTDREYAASAEVIEDAEICFVDKSFINHLVHDDPALALNVIRRLGDELAVAEERLSDILNKDVRQRFIRLLLTLQKTHGKKESNGMFLDVRLTRNELGAMVGATPETIIRLLSALHDEGHVHLDGKKIFIKDGNALLHEIETDS